MDMVAWVLDILTLTDTLKMSWWPHYTHRSVVYPSILLLYLHDWPVHRSTERSYNRDTDHGWANMLRCRGCEPHVLAGWQGLFATPGPGVLMMSFLPSGKPRAMGRPASPIRNSDSCRTSCLSFTLGNTPNLTFSPQDL
jgi:hypothetical protein